MDGIEAPGSPELEAEVLLDLGDADLWGLLPRDSTAWARLYSDFLSLHARPDDPEPIAVIPTVMVRTAERLDGEGRPEAIRFTSDFHSHEMSFETPEEAERWRAAIREEIDAHTTHAFDAFAPVREATQVRFFVDGRDYFAAVADAIERARQNVLVAGWWISPEVVLRRGDPPLDATFRLDRILARAAARGVRVFVLVYGETGIELASERAVLHLRSLHPNIRAIRHSPPLADIYYSHHQKFVVVDEEVAFVGGLDLCFGRFDTPDHPVADPGGGDPTRHLFPGLDYYNPSVHEADNAALAEPWRDLFDRRAHPRMPWHDVECAVRGDAARDVALAFVQRWNQHYIEEDELAPPVPLRPAEPSPPPAGDAACSGQVLRSLAEWNGGAYVETSIYRAWLDAIQRTERFLYVEQQFFISSLAGEPVQNRIAEAILERVARAIRAGEEFVVVLVLPVHPEGSFHDSVRVRAMMDWQYRTLCRGGGSLLERLGREFPGTPLARHVGVFALRSHGLLGDRPATSQVYVHSKLLIADDRVAILGSANVNDRSLLGLRDSEIAVRIDSGSHSPSRLPRPGELADPPTVRAFRMALFNHHLGLPRESTAAADALEAYRKIWLPTASRNTALYQEAFPDLPHSSTPSFEALSFAGASPSPGAAHALEGVRGFLVEFPLDFLRNEDLTTSLSDVEYYLGDELFT